jgi:hypothetical protein
MKSWQLLGYFGLLPFIACLYLSIASINSIINTEQAFIAYSAIIVSFIAGSFWRKDDNNTQVKEQIFSNVISLIAFATLLVDRDIALIVLSFCFLLLFLYEKKLSIFYEESNRSTQYMTMRLWLTIIVILLHIAGYILWFY